MDNRDDDFVSAVGRMRNLQLRYFKTRQHNLIKPKQEAEHRVDVMLVDRGFNPRCYAKEEQNAK